MYDTIRRNQGKLTMSEELAHPSLRNVVADQSFFAHIVARDHECALKIYTTSTLAAMFTNTIL